MWQRGGRAGEPLAIQLHRASSMPNHGAVTRHDGKGAGLLVGERLYVQIAVSLTSSSALGGSGLRVSERMLGLIQPNASSARQGDPGDASPAFLIKWPGDWDLSPLQFLCRRLDVLAQQVELVIVLLLGRVDRQLRGRKGEDEPTAARIHGVKPEYVSKERAVRLGILAVDQNVRARNHRLHAASLASSLSRFLRRRPRAWPVP